MDYQRRLEIVRETLDNIAPGSYEIDGPTLISGREAFTVTPHNSKSASIFLEATEDVDCFHIGVNCVPLRDGDKERLRQLVTAIAMGQLNVATRFGEVHRLSIKVGGKWYRGLHVGAIYLRQFRKRVETFEPYKI